MLKHTLHYCFIFCLLLLPASASQASATRYVSDDLTIPMRTGITNKHKILKFIPSGALLTIIETSEDGAYIKTQVDGTEGWVEANLLQDSPGRSEARPVGIECS